MRLAGLADAVLAEPTLAAAVDDARDNRTPALDLTGPAALRPFVVAGLARADRTVLVVTATVREAEDLVEELADVVDPGAEGGLSAHVTVIAVLGTRRKCFRSVTCLNLRNHA